MTSSSVKNNKHHMLENVESPVSAGNKKAIKKMGEGVERGNKFLRSRYENATPNLCWVFCALLGVLCN